MKQNRVFYGYLTAAALIGCFVYGGRSMPFIFFSLLLLPAVSGLAFLFSIMLVRIETRTTLYEGM
ncbi:MAG: hypothetical protein LBN42_02470, partial [Oscillospiraceae bacterium]|nr:hypothetical protein [Oscillospiraceae bacterium]